MRYFFMVCIQVNHSWSLELFHNKFITKRCSKNFLPVLGEGCSISIIWSSFLSIFLIAWFVSEFCPLYWLQTNVLLSVLFVPLVAFAVSNREKAKMNQILIFRLKFAVLKRLLALWNAALLLLKAKSIKTIQHFHNAQ